MCLLQKLNGEKTSPTSAVFGEAIRGTRVESLDVGWLEKKVDPIWIRILARRSSRGHVTNWAVWHFARRCVFWWQPCDNHVQNASLGYRSETFEQVWVQLAFVCSREAKPRGPAIKDYYAKNSHHRRMLTQCSWKWFRSRTDLNSYFIKSDTWFD